MARFHLLWLALPLLIGSATVIGTCARYDVVGSREPAVELVPVESGLFSNNPQRTTAATTTIYISIKNIHRNTDENDINSQSGELTIEGLGKDGRIQQLDSIKHIEFFGLGQPPQRPVVFRKVVPKDANVPVPTIWRKPYNARGDGSDEIYYEDSDGTEQVGERASVWYGEERHHRIGSATLMCNPMGEIYGSIFDANESYSIRTSIDSNGVLRYYFDVVGIDDFPNGIDEDRDSPSDEENQDRYLRSRNSRSLSVETPEALDESVVDVLVIYTEVVKDKEGGESGVKNLIDFAVYQTNVAFANSGSSVTLRLAKAVEDAVFPDDGSQDAWQSLKARDDGYFDEVWDLRDQFGADIVMLIADKLPGYCGVAYIGGPLGIVSRSCATKSGVYSFVHEVGHQFRAHHDIEAEGSSSTNRGYVDKSECFRTVMSYDHCGCSVCPRILYFSNVRTTYEGLAVGSAKENNIETMENEAHVLEAKNLAILPEAEREETSAPVPVSAPPNTLEVEPINTPAPMTVPTNPAPTPARLPQNIRGKQNGLPKRTSPRPPARTPIPVRRSATIATPAVELCTNDPCELNPSKVTQSRTGGMGRYPILSGSDTTSRINTPAGWYIEAFEGFNFSGKRWVFGSFDSDKSFSLTSYGANNKISSCIVRQVPSQFGVLLCNESDCVSGSKFRLPIGSYKRLPMQLGRTGLSRIILAPGWQIEIFDQENFRGASTILLNAHNSVAMSYKFENELSRWNGRVRSIILSTND